MLDKAQEDMIQSICFGLKKIKNKSKNPYSSPVNY